MPKKKNKKENGSGMAQQTAGGPLPLPDASTQDGQPPTISAHVDNPANASTQDKPLPNTTRKSKAKFDVVKAWQEYFGEGNLDDWARFCRDLGLEGDFSSKKKCKKAMKSVWINIYDFLQTPDKSQVTRFPSEAALSGYTLWTRKLYPRNRIEADSPLKLLLANILYPRWWMGRKKIKAKA
ncbi:hypothetical protein CONLIGDRAFT_675840 [Coniochaeta ligniaria NRRL 30616]|uniref:Uncharacterized protein n=1 Tax=Coniochaeta ligniaria NRRL 30616 TaxID=1408157 RepID=A0A1J7JXQ6_9PEZI|nr:hypothetical protein CONLIGDRAFT_675840 [Coniochaeta ligniaria NRRL 30616]